MPSQSRSIGLVSLPSGGNPSPAKQLKAIGRVLINKRGHVERILSRERYFPIGSRGYMLLC